MRSRYLPLTLLLASAATVAAAPGAGAKARPCKAPKVKLGKLCVNVQTRAANGSNVVIALQYGKGKPVRIVSANVRQPLTATCSDGTSQPFAFVAGGGVPITGPSFTGTIRKANSAGETVIVIRGRFTSNTRVVIDELSQTFPKGGGVTCTLAARNVVIQQGR